MKGPRESMSGKVCLVTGGSSGIGEVAARELAGLGATVVIVGRNPERLAATRRLIEERTPAARVDSLQGDLASQREVRRVADEFVSRYDRLDVLLNNAGAAYPRRRESTDGIELTFALNHLGYFLLTRLLEDRLRSSAPARVVNVASDAHRYARGGFDFEDYQRTKRYSSFRVYGESKLANILFTREYSRRLEGTGVMVNALHPGFVRTRFGSNQSAGGKLFWNMLSVFAIPVEAGARTPIYLASSPDVSSITGGYFDRCKPSEPTAYAKDDAAAARLWTLSEELVSRSA
jgi:NAD(P)-dependent dehydrogenase (short-subunit alcohol dehydrogenase family)